MCDEVSMCLCFWLTAVVARRSEQLPPLLVDPTCRRGDMVGTTGDSSRAFVAPKLSQGVVLSLDLQRAAHCGTSFDNTYESTSP